MVKIGPFNIRWGSRRDGAFVGETLKAKHSPRYNFVIGDRTYNWPMKCDEYDRYYNDNPQIKSQVLTLAGRATANGIFLELKDDRAINKEALDKCEKLNQNIGLDQLLYETIIPLVKYGTVLWEQTFTPKYDVQLIPIVKEYKPVKFEHFNVSQWEILENGSSRKPRILLNEPQFIEYSWNKTSTSWPFGTSLLVGLGRSLEILNNLVESIDEYVENAAFPSNVIGVGDTEFGPNSTQVSSIESKIKNRDAGDSFVTNWPITIDTLGPAAAEPRMVPDILNFIKEQIIDGTLTPPVSKQYQRSLASAEEMTDATEQSVIIPIQRLLKRVIERKVYWPYLEGLGYSVRNVPSVSFTPPDQDKVQEAEYYGMLIDKRIITPEAAARELGIDEKDIPEEPEPIIQQLPQLPDVPPEEDDMEETFSVKISKG